MSHADVFSNQTANKSAVYDISGVRRFAVTWQKTGTGECNVKIMWKVDGGDYVTIPNGESTHDYTLAAGAQSGEAYIENYGMTHLKVELYGVGEEEEETVSVDAQAGFEPV